MSEQKRERLTKEYRRIQEDYEALLNTPAGMRLCNRYLETVQWLERRILVLENALLSSAT